MRKVFTSGPAGIRTPPSGHNRPASRANGADLCKELKDAPLVAREGWLEPKALAAAVDHRPRPGMSFQSGSSEELAQVMAAESRLDGWVPPLFGRDRRPLRFYS